MDPQLDGFVQGIRVKRFQSGALNLFAILLTFIVFVLLFVADANWNGFDPVHPTDLDSSNSQLKSISDFNWPPPNISITTLAPSSIYNQNGHSKIDARQYATVSFGGTCAGARFSNRLFEMMALYGIARSIDRIPYANMYSECVQNVMKDMNNYFPRLVLAFEPLMVHYNMTKNVSFGDDCCSYDDVNKLNDYRTSQYIRLSGDFMQSYKYFHPYKTDVLKLIAFSSADIKESEQLAKEIFQDELDHRVCVHIRRADYVSSNIHQESTESFTKAAIKYVRDKVHSWGRNTAVALIGDDREWMKKLFPHDQSVHVPKRPDRPTVDYALFARHCDSIILTASASTFGFWSAYLSSAEFVYFNKKYALENTHLRKELKPEDFFLPEWISLEYNDATNEITVF